MPEELRSLYDSNGGEILVRSKEGHAVIRLGVTSSPISGYSASVILSGSTAPHAVELGVNNDDGGHIQLSSVDPESGTSSVCVLEAREYGGRVTVQGENGTSHLFSGGVMVNDKDGKVLLNIRGAD